MESIKPFEHCLLLRVGVVANGSRCLSIMSRQCSKGFMDSMRSSPADHG